jgi:hypothetical protein
LRTKLKNQIVNHPTNNWWTTTPNPEPRSKHTCWALCRTTDGFDGHEETMECFVFDTLVENLTNYTEEELITEISDTTPNCWTVEQLAHGGLRSCCPRAILRSQAKELMIRPKPTQSLHNARSPESNLQKVW